MPIIILPRPSFNNKILTSIFRQIFQEEYRYIYFFITELINSPWLRQDFTTSDSIHDTSWQSKLDQLAAGSRVFSSSTNFHTSVPPNKHSDQFDNDHYMHDLSYQTENPGEYLCAHSGDTDPCAKYADSKSLSFSTDPCTKCAGLSSLNFSYAKRVAKSRKVICSCSDNMVINNNTNLPPAFVVNSNSNSVSLYESSINGNLNTANTQQYLTSPCRNHSNVHQLLDSKLQSPVPQLYVGNNDSGVVVQIHASYASMEDTPECYDDREHRSSFDSVNT